MQITVISEGLLLNSKYIKMGREEGGFQAFLTQPPLVIVCKRISQTFIRNRRQDGETAEELGNYIPLVTITFSRN